MLENINMRESQVEFFKQNEIIEFPCFCIARQGGRTAMEILTRALILEGKYTYLGQNLTGLRSMGTNSFVIRFGDTREIPPGFSINNPKGILLMHDAMLGSGRGLDSFMSAITPQQAMSRLKNGVLMVSTTKSPEELDYPYEFEGTVATVDAEGIFSERINIQPAPSGITTLGLFAAATGNMVSLDALKEATMGHERLKIDIRKANVLCLEDVYKKTKVVHNLKFEAPDPDRSSKKSGKTVRQSLSTKWRRKIPVCNVAECKCAWCASACYCPETAIVWRDDIMEIDYDVCKACGTCVVECLRGAITMEDSDKVISEKNNQERSDGN